MAKGKGEAGEKVNKSKIVAAAIEALGGNPGPKDIIAYVKEQHGLDFSYALVASYKSNYMNKKNKPGKKASKGGSGGGGLDVKDVVAVKGLIDKLGKSQLESIISAFS